MLRTLRTGRKSASSAPAIPQLARANDTFAEQGYGLFVSMASDLLIKCWSSGLGLVSPFVSTSGEAANQDVSRPISVAG